MEAVNKKAGPFDLLLCTGTFFGSDEVANDGVLSGTNAPPISTYLMGPTSPGDVSIFEEKAEGEELGPNLTYLGPRGVLSAANGLAIAYLGGQESERRSELTFDVDSVQELCIPATANLQFQGVDVLLTHSWPASVTKWGPKPQSDPPDGSALISQVATILKPRYHFASHSELHYERPPYRNHKVLKEGPAQCTRFISLAPVANATKSKWLYAFSIKPLKFLPRTELIAQPPDASEFPFDEVLRDLHIKQREQAEAASGGNKHTQFFYDVEAGPEKGNERRRGRGKRDWQGDEDREPIKRSPCWFCLSSPEVQKHMVVTVGNEAYMALAKGQLTSQHILLLPIGHFQSLVAAPEPVRAEIARFKSALVDCFKLKGMGMVFWERNFRSQHAQIQGIPVPHKAIKELRDTFLAAGRVKGLELVECEEEIWNVVEEEGIPYFHLELPQGPALITRQMSDFPLQWAREVLAGEELLNLPGKVDWRQATQTKEEETDNAIALRKIFQKFDFTQEDSDSE